MKRNSTRIIHAILLLFTLCAFCRPAAAQYDVYANQLVSNSSDFNNASRATDANPGNYAYISTLLGVLTTSDIRVRFPEWGSAGDVVNVTVQGSAGLLDAGVLDNITIKLYDSAGTVPVATASGSSVLQLGLVTPGTNLYNIRFITSIVGAYRFKEAKLELNNVLSVSLTSFRVYGFYFQRPCPPVYANNIVGSTATPLLASVDNEGRIVDANPDNYATLNTLISLLGIGSASVDVSFPLNGRAGDYVGFTVANPTGLLDVDVLGGLTLITYDASGAVRESRSGSSLLDLKLLSGTTNRYTVGFLTTKGSYRIAKVRLVKTAVVGLLSNLRVYNSFYYSINRPPVTVSTSGPTTLCEGGSVTLAAYDSLGAGNYTWSTGATSSSITVTNAGTYTVEVTDSFSCTRRSIPVTVEISPGPKPVIKGDSVLCNGGSGALNLGSAVYASQLWSTGSTSPAISGVTPGLYYVTVTDANSCKGSDTVVVMRNRLNIASTITPASCANSTDGSVVLNVSGGSGSYTYRWSDGSTAAAITGKMPGIYTCIVSDNVYNCTYNRSFTLTSANTLLLKSATVNTSACAATDGKINLSVVGGSGTYTYLWSNGAATANLSNLGAGIYTVLVTDAGTGCSVKDTMALGDGANSLVLTPSVTHSTSCSSPNGAASVSISGGSGSYAYNWSTGGTTASVSALAPGNYYVVVKDLGSNCSKALSVSIGNNASLTVNTTVTNPGCQKQNGSLTVASVSGGSGTYTYAWSNGSSASSISGLASGTYLLTVSDATSGCSRQQVYTLSDSSGPSATLTVTQPDCEANGNGAVSVSASGAANMYSWSNGSMSKNISGLKPGVYTLTITDTVSGCSTQYPVQLMIRQQLRLQASPVSNTSCAAAPNGGISLTVSGGAAPYSYSWSGGEATKDISGKNAGSYTVSITDANGCTAGVSVTLNTDSSKLLNASVGAITKASCNTAANGGAVVTVSGGKAPYTYSWSPGGAATKDLVNVIAGTYVLTVTDALGCTKQVTANITIDSAIAIRGTLDSTKASGCASSASGAAYVSISGGATPYSYSWKRGSVTVATTEDLIGVTAGSYTLTVTDNNGCTVVLNATVGVLPSGVSVALDSVQRPTCLVSADGKVYVSVSGGLTPYTYSWSNGATTEDLISANPGTLVLTVTDANGCPGQLIVNLSYDTSKTLVVKNDSLKGAGCLTGKSAAVYITASGGTAPYSYLWSDGSVGADLMNVLPGSYTVQVTDARGCRISGTTTVGIDTALSIRAVVDSVEGAGCSGSKSGKISVSVSRGVAPYLYSWSNGATTEDISNVAPGAYTLVVSDAAGCNKTLSASVGIDTAKKIVVTVDSVRGASCSLAANGALFISVKGGQAPYNYSWSNGATTANLVGAAPGFYSLNLIDASGCAASLSATITVDPAKALKVAAVSVKDAGCSGNASGAINIDVLGGVPPYTYSWSNGAITKDVNSLVPGSYTVRVKDAAGCSEDFSTIIKVDTANLIELAVVSVADARCAGSSSGSINVSVSGGVPPYTYMWSNGAITKDLSYVKSGSYLLNVMDAIGCTAQLSVNVGINNTNPVTVKLDSVRNVGCVDTASGAIYVSVIGGMTPYTYLWSNGAATQDIVGVPKGAYLLNVTDDAGCFDNLSTTVGTATPIVVAADQSDVSCYGGTEGSIVLKVSNGSGLYAYKWSDGNLNNTRNNLGAGSYTVKVSDVVSGCTEEKTFNIAQPDSLSVSATVMKDSCLPGFDGSVQLQVSGGTSPYTYAWSNGGNSDAIRNVGAMDYSVSITDSKGCKIARTFTVSQAKCDFSIDVHDVITPNGDGMNDTWIIEGIEFYPGSHVQVVDKWGDLVYERRPYDNSFNGFNSKTGAELPSGTYYYILRLNEANKNGGESTFKGSLLIKR